MAIGIFGGWVNAESGTKGSNTLSVAGGRCSVGLTVIKVIKADTVYFCSGSSSALAPLLATPFKITPRHSYYVQTFLDPGQDNGKINLNKNKWKLNTLRLL